MQLNTSTDYAIRMVLYLAKHGRVIPSAELSEHINISRRYTMLIASRMRDAGIIGVSKGSVGGYYLLREPTQISIYDIVVAMEGKILISHRPDDDGQKAEKLISLYEVYSLIKHHIINYMTAMTFDILIHKSPEEWRKIVLDLIKKDSQKLYSEEDKYRI